MRPDDQRLWWAGLAVAAAIVLYIAATRNPRPVKAPCDLDARWRLACERFEEQGWPPCTTTLGGVQLVYLTPEMLPGEDVRGAWDPTWEIVGIRDDACGDSDPTMEHEQGHARGLVHGGPSGSVMASPYSRTGLKIPRYVR